MSTKGFTQGIGLKILYYAYDPYPKQVCFTASNPHFVSQHFFGIIDAEFTKVSFTNRFLRGITLS